MYLKYRKEEKNISKNNIECIEMSLDFCLLTTNKFFNFILIKEKIEK